MKAPMALPFVEKGEDIPPSGVTAQAILGFLLPFILIILCGIIIYFMISARINPLSKSEWITPAACGAEAPRGIVQARTSSGPAVKKVMRPRS